MNLLARREHSRVELSRKLKDKEYTSDEIEAALDRLRDEGLQSDARFCEGYVRYRAHGGFGPLRITQEMQQKGISHDMIARYLAPMKGSWPTLLYAAWEKKFSHTIPEDIKARGKQYRFLLMRGFEARDIHDLFQRLGQE